MVPSVSLSARVKVQIINALARQHAKALLTPEMHEEYAKALGMEAMVALHWPEDYYDLIAQGRERTAKIKTRLERRTVINTCPECENHLKQITWDDATKLVCACGWSEWVDISFPKGGAS